MKTFTDVFPRILVSVCSFFVKLPMHYHTAAWGHLTVGVNNRVQDESSPIKIYI